MTHEQIVIDLPALLHGELDRARLAEVVQHLETCDECRLELVAATQGHSAVTAAVRTLRPETGPATAPRAHDGVVPELPPLAHRRRRWPRWQQGLVAAVAAVVLGAAVVVGLNRESAPTVPVQTARLSAVTGAGSGEVTMRSPGRRAKARPSASRRCRPPPRCPPR